MIHVFTNSVNDGASQGEKKGESTTFIVKSPNFDSIFRTFFTRKMQKRPDFPFILFLSNCPQTWYNNQVRYTAAFSALENGVFDYD